MENLKVTELDNSWVDSSKPTISISEVIGMIREPFDSKAVAEKTKAKHYDIEGDQYYHKSVEEILEMWESKGAVSREYGKRLDDYIGIRMNGTEDELEMYKLDYDYDADERLKRITGAFENFYENAEKSELKFVGRELTMYYDMGDFYVKGRTDALFEKDKLHVIDWKSNENIPTTTTRFTNKMLGAAKEYDDIDGVAYTIQTYFYKLCLMSHNYLGRELSESDITTSVVNLNGKESSGNLYTVVKPLVAFDKSKLEAIFTFAYKKKNLLKKINENK